jgi:hypothetical protein
MVSYCLRDIFTLNMKVETKIVECNDAKKCGNRPGRSLITYNDESYCYWIRYPDLIPIYIIELTKTGAVIT